MKLLPKIPLGDEDENGFRVTGEPDIYEPADRRSRNAARNVLVWGVLAWLALMVWLVWQLAK